MDLQPHGTGFMKFSSINLEMGIYPHLTLTMILFQMFPLLEVSIGEEKIVINWTKPSIQEGKLVQSLLITTAMEFMD